MTVQGENSKASTDRRTRVVLGTPEALKIAGIEVPITKELSGLVDSGQREDFETGATREPAVGRGRFDLIPPAPLRRLAKHYENGAIKYAERNWEKGLPVSNCYNSASRHMLKFLEGSTDEDHLAAIVWNIFSIMHYEEHLPQMVDIPTRPEFSKHQLAEILKEEVITR